MKKAFLCFKQHPWLITIALTFGVMGMQIATQGLLITYIAKTLNTPIASIVSYDALALITSLFVNSCSGKIMTWLSEIGTRRLSAILFCLSNILLFLLLRAQLLTSSYYLALQVLNGIALGLIYPALNNAILKQTWQANLKSSVLTMVNITWSIGFFSAAEVLHLILTFTDAKFLLILMAVGFLAIVYLHNLLLKKYQTTNTRTTQQTYRQSNYTAQTHKFPLKTGFLSLTIVLAGIALFSTTFSQNTIEYWFPSFMEVDKLIPMSTAAAIMSLFGIGQATGRLIFGVLLLPIVNLYHFVRVSFLVLAVLMVLFLLNNNILIFYSIVLAIGLASACLLPAVMSLISAVITNYNEYHTSYMIFMNSLGSCMSLLVTSAIGKHYHNDALAIATIPIILLANIIFVSLLRSIHNSQKTTTKYYAVSS